MRAIMRKMLLCVLSSVLVVSILLPAGASAEPVVKEWNIPFLCFLTGPYAGFGKIIEWCTNEGIKDVNSTGGPQGRPLAVKYYDTALDPTKAVAEMTKFVGESLIIWGPIAAHEVKAAMPLAVRNKVLAVSVACGYDVSMQFVPWQLHFFGSSATLATKPMQGWAKRNPEMKSVVQFVWPTDPTWMDLANAQKKALEQVGVKVLPNVECGESVDMGAAVVKAMAGNPDGFVITVGPVEAGKIILELEKRGLKDKGRIMVFNTAAGPALFEIAGNSLNGAYHYYAVNVDSKKPKFQEKAKKFEETFKMQPTFDLPMFYDMVTLTAEALEKTGVTGAPAKLAEERAKLADYMRNRKGFNGLSADFDVVNGFAQYPSYLYQFKDRRKVLIEEFVNQ